MTNLQTTSTTNPAAMKMVAKSLLSLDRFVEGQMDKAVCIHSLVRVAWVFAHGYEDPEQNGLVVQKLGRTIVSLHQAKYKIVAVHCHNLLFPEWYVERFVPKTIRSYDEIEASFDLDTREVELYT